jgi:hypothetical protein
VSSPNKVADDSEELSILVKTLQLRKLSIKGTFKNTEILRFFAKLWPKIGVNVYIKEISLRHVNVNVTSHKILPILVSMMIFVRLRNSSASIFYQH